MIKMTFRLLLDLICRLVSLLLVSEVFPMQMEGVRLVVNKGLSNHFQVTEVTFYVF